MAYENNNVRVGANGAGVYIGNAEILGGIANNISVKKRRLHKCFN